jgi:D-alanine-D-alanine ligase
MKKNIAVIFGGRSVEHDVSIITAHTPIIDALIATGNFNVIPIYISKDGCWYYDKEMININYFKDKELEIKIKKLKKLQIKIDNGLHIIIPGIKNKDIKIDIAFPSMHGTYGEDGSLMGLLRMAGVSFVGCDIFASAVAMDKALTKQVLSSQGLPIVPYIWFDANEWENAKNTLIEKAEKLKYPLFVKPVHLGSSIAITKATNNEELNNAIEVALHYDEKVLVEKSIENLIEVTLPIIGQNNDIKLGAIERALNKSDFFNFNDKYISGSKKGNISENKYSEIPAKIDEKLYDKVEELGIKAFKAIGCEGISRIDFLIDKNSNIVYINEINTLPGSLYHHNFKEMGISSMDLVKKLVLFAEKRFIESKNINITFKSSILNKAGGNKI